MVAHKVEIRTIGNAMNQPLTLILKSFSDGWSYEVQDLSSGPLPLPWRTETRAQAEKQLMDSYDTAIWKITVIEPQA